MRKLLSIAGLILCLFYGNAIAQAPEASTASNPKWYFIQAVGSGATANRVVTAVGSRVEGQPLASDNISVLNNQLWRLELKSGVGYALINKSSGKTLSVSYEHEKDMRVATTSSTTSVFWRYSKQTGNTGYSLRLADETNLEGVSGDIYLYQSPSAQGYELIYAGLSKSTEANASFNFVLSEIPVISTNDEEVWMYVKNTKTEKYLTDAVISPQGKAYFILDNLITDENGTRQQWKLIKKVNSNSLLFVNRATGNSIHTDMAFDLYYYMQFTNDPAEGDGWNIELISDNQYAVYTTDANGIVKYWYATTPGKPTESFDKGYAKNSAYAWAFSWAPDINTGIKTPDLPDNIRVYSFDKRICVEGCDNYKIFTIHGIPVYKNANLPAGVYLVTVEGKTAKVPVK